MIHSLKIEHKVIICRKSKHGPLEKGLFIAKRVDEVPLHTLYATHFTYSNLDNIIPARLSLCQV